VTSHQRSGAGTWSLVAARAAFLLGVVLALLVAGCRGDGTAEGDGNGTSGAATSTPASGEEARVAQTGDTVSVHYRGTLDNGEEFDSSRGREPLTFTIGVGQVIEGFDSAVTGMAIGESRTVRLEAAQAYGERRDDLVVAVPKDQAPEGLAEGQQVLLGNTPATVIDVNDTEITVDANHPLAGEALTFEIELVSIQ
jgi:peptidylprolyl isomerase